MPQRHLIIILMTGIFSFACYEISFRQRVASVVAEAADLMKKEGLYEVDDKELTQSAVKGMLTEIDRFSDFYAGAEAKSQKEFLQQEYKGLGINIRRDSETGYILVLRAFWGSPAMEAGLLPGDLITAVDGVPFHKDDKVSSVYEKLRGPENSKAELTVLRDSKEGKAEKDALTIIVVRKAIKTDSVFGYKPNGKGGWYYILPNSVNETDPTNFGDDASRKGVAYIRLDKFGERTPEELTEAINSVKDRMTGLILDLRNNPGGFLVGAVEISDMFLSEKNAPIVTQRDRHGNTVSTSYTENDPIIPESIPMAVLINGNSASASEIVSACLQDYGRAVIVGQRSFGKGTVQSYFPLSLPGSFLKLTTATYWRPSEKNIHKMRFKNTEKQQEFDQKQKALGKDDDWGVKPDPGFELALSAIDSEELSVMRGNSEIGIDIDNISSGYREYFLELQKAVDDAASKNPDQKKPKWESLDQIRWNDGKSLLERDIQLQKAMEAFAKK